MPTKNGKQKKDNTASRAIGAGVGIAGGAAAGAAAGSLVGPAGTAIGAVVGAAVGGLAGDQVADAIDPAEEEGYWESQYASRPYYDEETDFEEYRPAYRYGIDSATQYAGEDFSTVEPRLKRNWTKVRGDSSLSWNHARDAVQDAFDRTIQLREERLNVSKENVEAGEVAVRKEVVADRQRIDVPVEREEVVVTRRPARGKAASGPITPEKEEIRIPVKEERVRVSKEVVPVEEVSVGRRKVRDTHHVDETVRKEKLKVEKKGNVKVQNQKKSSRAR